MNLSDFTKEKEREPIKLKKRSWFFRWLRERIGLNALALEFYKTRTEVAALSEVRRKQNEFKSNA